VLGWTRRSSGAGNVVIEGSQSFGTGGSPSANVTAISPTTITLTTDWEPFAAVLTVPSIAGKTLGTDGNDFLSLNFWTSAGSDFNARTNSLGIQTIGVDLWGIHIKRGVHTAGATEAYRAPELGQELARCQRYFQRLPIQVADEAAYAARFTSSFASATWTFAQEMRVPPSITLAGGVTGSGASLTTAFYRLFSIIGDVIITQGSTADAEL
jgi:hypothetical protein